MGVLNINKRGFRKWRNFFFVKYGIHILLKLNFSRRITLGHSINCGIFTQALYLTPQELLFCLMVITMIPSLSLTRNIRAGQIKYGQGISLIIRHGQICTILRMLDYNLPALTLTEVECKKVLSVILQTGLNYIGICHNFP